MFLDQVSSNEVKELTLELAYLVSVSEDKQNKHPNSYKLLFSQYLSKDEMDKLTLFSKNMGIESYLDQLISGISNFGNGLDRISKEIAEKYSKNPDVKKETFKIITGNNLDILSLSPKEIEKIIINLPEIKKEIIQEFTKRKIQAKIRAAKLEVNEKDKKIILVSLLDMAYSNNTLCPTEIELVNIISDELGIDKEYIEEFTEPVKRISSSMKEIIELINE